MIERPSERVEALACLKSRVFSRRAKPLEIYVTDISSAFCDSCDITDPLRSGRIGATEYRSYRYSDLKQSLIVARAHFFLRNKQSDVICDRVSIVSTSVNEFAFLPLLRDASFIFYSQSMRRTKAPNILFHIRVDLMGPAFVRFVPRLF